MLVNQEIKWIERKDLSIAQYDKLVEQAHGVSIYAFSWYLDAVSDQWAVLVYGNYEAVMPVPYTIKKGQHIIYQPFFSRQIGIYGEHVDEQLIFSFFRAIPEKFKLVDFGFPNFVENNFTIESVMHQKLDLSKSYEEIYKGYSSNAKRQIKKAEKKGVEVKELKDPNVLISLFKESKGEEIGLTDENFSRLTVLMKKGLAKKSGILLGAFYENELIASAYYFIRNNRITYLKGAGNKQGREFGGMYLLMDFMIKKYSEKQFCLDFGGSKIESIAGFYKRFGASDHEYYLYSKNKLAFPLKLAKKLRDRLKAK